MANDRTLFKILPRTPQLEATIEGESDKFSKATGLDKDLYFFPVMQQFKTHYDRAIKGNDEEKVKAKQVLTEFLLPQNTPNRSNYLFADPRKLPELKDIVLKNYEAELSQIHSKHGKDIVDKVFSDLDNTTKEVYKKAEEGSKGKSDAEKAIITGNLEKGLVPILLQYISLLDLDNDKIKDLQEIGEYLEGRREKPPEAFSRRVEESIKEIAKDAGPLKEIVAWQLLRDIEENPGRQNLMPYVSAYSEGIAKRLIDDYRENGKISINKLKKFAKEKLEKNPKGYEALVSEYYARSLAKK